MTVMSDKNALKFSKILKFIFPRSQFFFPEDYYEAFSLVKGELDIGLSTYKKYVGIVCDSGHFPELTRSRENSRSPYMYYVGEFDTEDAEVIRTNLGRTGSTTISDTSLVNFINRIKPLLNINSWYKIGTLRSKYNRYNRRLKTKTISYYMSLAFRRDIWKGLERRVGSNGMYEYKWCEDTDSVTHTPIPQELGEVMDGVVCSSCGEDLPRSARFCMACGKPVGPKVRAVVQESVVQVPLPASFSSPPSSWKIDTKHVISQYIKHWALKRIAVSVEVTDGDACAIIFLKEEDLG